jgi:hypothetical protein
MGKVAAISSKDAFKYESKGHDYDPYLRSFIKGALGVESSWEDEKDTDSILVIRGLGGGSQRVIKKCWETGRPFYAIDTGYFGNSKHKVLHRITYNALQNMQEMVPRDNARLNAQLGSWKNIYKPFTPGRKILICPPSDKVMKMFNQLDAATWTANLVEQLKILTDRPIEIRMKPIRSERVSTKTIQQALADDVHCLITYNSIAATEALMEGKPAITLGPNAAQLVCETNLKYIETPRIPSEDEMYFFLKHLSYAHFTQEEMENGVAWKILRSNIK